MRIESLTYTPSGRTGSIAQQLTQWRVGAIVDATVGRDALTGQFTLNIDGTEMPVRLLSQNGSSPTEGEQLRLRILRDSPTLALETVENEAPNEATLGDAVRKYLPRQAPPSLLLANLDWLARDGQRSEPFGSRVTNALKNLWQMLPQSSELMQPDKLAATIARSGVQLEAQLGKGDVQQTVQRDLKALMLGLRQALSESPKTSAGATAMNVGPPPMTGDTLKPLPSLPATLSVIDAPERQLSELSRQTEGALARMTALQAAGASGGAWILEIPVRNEDRTEFVRMKFERGARRNEQEEAPWNVEVALDLGMAGEMFARVTWAHRQISVQLRAASPAVVTVLQQYAPQLSDSLRSVGLDVQQIICLHGMPADMSERRAASLLDVRA